MHRNLNSSHKQILKATGIIGGAQVAEVLIRIARNKIIAVLLGPLGVGITGLYQSTIDLIRSATGFGLNFSAVRDIAQAAGTNDRQRISRTILILRRWVWFTGLLGMVVTLIFCKPLSRYTFGDEGYAWGIAVLSLVLIMFAVSEGQLALLQGLRQISMMARARVLGVLAGFCISVPLYWMMGVQGIVPAILFSVAASLFLSWFYSRRVPIHPVALSAKETFQGGLGMVRLGFFMVITGFATTAAMYLVRAFISNKSGLDGVGQFQAAWSLSTIYLGAVLQAMGTDYFPRLSSVSHDNTQMVRLANEQTEIALYIAGPLIVGMISFVSLVVTILYSGKFTETIGLLQWQLAGTFLKVICWPMGFIILAKGWGGVFIFTELCWNAIYLCLIYLCWDSFGLEITGMAFLLAYFIYIVIVFVLSRRLSGFIWYRSSFTTVAVFLVITALAFLSSRYIAGTKNYYIGGLLTLSGIGYSFYKLRKIIDLNIIIKKLLH
ncbi:O-antigen translocase [Planctomycetota bacterium]